MQTPQIIQVLPNNRTFKTDIKELKRFFDNPTLLDDEIKEGLIQFALAILFTDAGKNQISN